MTRKEPTREKKIECIKANLEESYEHLDDEYLDDLLAIAQQYHLIAMEQQKIKMN